MSQAGIALARQERLVLALRGRQFLRMECDAVPVPWPTVLRWLRWYEPEQRWTETDARTLVGYVDRRTAQRPRNEHGGIDDGPVDRTDERDAALLGRLLASGAIGPADLRLLVW